MVLSKLLLSAGADVNSQCMGCSPFSYAIRFGCVGLVDLYIQHGASVLAASGDENAFFLWGKGLLRWQNASYARCCVEDPPHRGL